MKTKSSLIIAASVCGLSLAIQPGFAQGSLTPPGAPAPTMKSLDQIEPRTIVNAGNTPGNGIALFVINQPGSYYLTTNITGVSGKNGIQITTNNVTLDLNGFALQGVPGASNGIYMINPSVNITVRNGTISGWPSEGIYDGSQSSLNIVCERLNASGNAVGINLYGAGVVRDCNCQSNIFDGMDCNGGAIISGCRADYNGGDGISVVYGTVSGCAAQNNIIDGYFVEFGSVSCCTAQSNGRYGIRVNPASVAGCHVESSGQSGIEVDQPGSTVIGNTCIGNNTANASGQAGIRINCSNNRVEENHVTASSYAGILVNTGFNNNIIVKNSVIGNGANNYIMPGGNDVGPIGAATNSTSPWANISH
jgi:hypothetical protein